MTLFPNSALEAAPVGAKPALRVSTKYMETFMPLQPISAGTEIHTFLDGGGSLDLYSVGTDGGVYRYRRSRDSAAPYEAAELGVKASQLYLFDPAGGDPDRPAIFGLDAAGKPTLATWQAGGYRQRNTGPQDEIIRRFAGVRGVSGRIYINVRLSDGRLANNFYDPVDDKWGGPSWVPIKGPDGKDAKVKDLTMAANNPVQSALFAIGEDDEVLFSEDSFRTSQLRKLYKKASHIAAIADADDLLNIFAVDRDSGALWVKKQRKYSTGGIQFEDWVEVDPGQRGRLTRLHVNLRRDNLVEVFALGEDGDLNYTRQVVDVRGKLAGWQTLFPLRGDMENRIFTVGRNANGYSEALSVTDTDEVARFWQSPETEQWFSELIDLPKAEDRLISVPTHSTEIFIVDGDGAPMPRAQVTVNAAFLNTLWINGKAVRSSIVDPVSLKTDESGKLVVLQRANALAGATLLISTPVTPAGEPIQVEPNGELQSRLARLTKDDVLDARDKGDKLLLPEDTKDRDAVAESIAEVSKRSMELAQAEEKAALIQYKFVSASRTGYRPHTDFSALGEVAWEIDFSSGVPIYRDTNLAAVQAFRTEYAGMLHVEGSAGGLSWGSVWSAIKSGINWVVEGLRKIVVTVVDGIAKVLFFIGEKVFEAVIKYAQQALDFIEGIWNWLKVKLEQLYEWLAFLFNFKDFARTAEGVKHAVGVVLDFSADAIHTVRDRVDEGFEFLKKDLSSIINKLVSELNGQGDPTMGGYFDQQPAGERTQHASDHNLFLNAFQQNHSKIRIKSAARTADDAKLQGALDGVLDKLKDLADNFEFGDGKQAFDEAYAYFDNIGKDPGKALQLLLSGVIKALEGATLFALDFAKGVVLSLFDILEDVIRAFRDAIFQEWEIPVLSQLYQLFTGDKLTVTPIDVCAWIAAIPMTLTSKIVLKRAPWNDSELKKFKRTFTADMLKKRLGMAAPDPAAAAGDSDDNPIWDPQWRENFLTGYCVVMAVRSLLDPSSAAASATGAGLGPAGIVPVGARFLTTIFTMPWALSPKATGPSCKPGEAGFGVTIWICQMLCGPLRGGVVHYLVPAGQGKIYTSELTLTLWGAANLIMTAVNFSQQKQTTANKLAFSRSILNLVPGQTLRFLAVPALNQNTYFIPAAILGVLSFASCWGSLGVAIAEIHTDPTEA